MSCAICWANNSDCIHCARGEPIRAQVSDEYDGTEACFKCSASVPENEWHEDCGLCPKCCVCADEDYDEQ